MKENDFKNRLVKVMRQRGAQVTPIENMVGVGCPDLHIVCFGIERWVETKGPASMTNCYVKLRKSQNAWMAQRDSHGKDSFILAHDGTTWELYYYRKGLVEPHDRDYVKISRQLWWRKFDTMDELIYTLLR